jgi:transcription antitermination factor NusG
MHVTENGEAMSYWVRNQTDMPGRAWYAIYTKPRWEKKVWQHLDAKGIHTYCPIQRVQRQWSDRKKIIEEPAIKSYLFVRVSPASMLAVLETPGVLHFVRFSGKPAVIRDAEMDAIQRFFQDIDPANAPLLSPSLDVKPLDSVRINQGVFMHEQGILVDWVGKRARIRIQRLNWEITVLFDRSSFSPS